jgi:acylphosphatase
MPTYRIHFLGQVQGVGFRATCRMLAGQFPALAGQVSNLRDGRVRLVVCGPREDVAGLVDRLNEAFSGYIVDVDKEELPPGDDTLPAGLTGVEVTRGG